MVFKSDSLMKTVFSLKAARISCTGQTETCESSGTMMQCQPNSL